MPMKYNLSIEINDAAELVKIAALLAGTTAIISTNAAGQTGAAGPSFQPQPAASGGASQQFTPAPAFAPQIAAAAPSGEVDSSGLPYDARIHAETKAKNKDGTWRGRRGVDDATIAGVTAELRARAPITVVQPQPEQFAPQPAAAFQPTPMQQQPAAPSPEQVFGAPPAPQFSPAPAAAAPVADPLAIPAFLQRQQPGPAAPMPQQPAPAPAAPPATMTFQQLMAAISQGLRDKKIDNAYLGQLVAHYQLPSIPALANTHAALMPQVVEALRQAGVV